MSAFTDIGFIFQSPYAPTSVKGEVCICVHCGQTAVASNQISTYPHRYAPDDWMVEASSRALSCHDCCFEGGKLDFAYVKANHVWVWPAVGDKRVEPRDRHESSVSDQEGSMRGDGGVEEVPVELIDRIRNLRSKLGYLHVGMTKDAAHRVNWEHLRNLGERVDKGFDVVKPTFPAMFTLVQLLKGYAEAMAPWDRDVFDWSNAFFTCPQDGIWLDHFVSLLERQVNEIEPDLMRVGASAEPAVVGGRVLRVQVAERGEGMTRLKRQAVETAGAVGMGLQLAAANEAGEVLVDLAKELFSENPMAQVFLQHPDGRELAKMLMAMLLQTGAEQTDLLPNPEAISHICKLQLTQSTSTLVAPRLKKVRRHLTKLAKLGNTAGAAAAAGAAPLRARISDDVDLDDVREQNEALLEELREMRAELDEIRSGGKRKGKEKSAG